MNSVLEAYWKSRYGDPFNSKAVWALKFIWFPKTCGITRRMLWLEWAYEGVAVWTGPGEPVYEYRWHDKFEHLIWELKEKP